MPTLAPPARGRPRDESLAQRRRGQILDAAARMFADRGYAETDLQLLADKLSVGKGTLYRYFPSKSDLFLAAVDRGMKRLGEVVDKARKSRQDPLDQLAAAIDAYLAFFSRHPQFVELFVQERAVFRDRRKATYFQHRDARTPYWRDVYRRLIAEGRFRDISAEQILDFIGDVVYGAMIANVFANRTRSSTIQARQIVDIVFHGILTDKERTRRRLAAKGAST